MKAESICYPLMRPQHGRLLFTSDRKSVATVRDAPSPDAPEKHAWHALAPGDTLRAFRTGPSGLGDEEAAQRLAHYGPNVLHITRPRGVWRRLLDQFRNLLIYVLLASSVTTAILGHWTDSAVIAGVVVINAIIGFVQEQRAEQALAAIRKLLASRARAIRHGRTTEIDAADLVPGDIVVVESGDRIPADLRLTEAHGLEVDESALTGESVPVTKHTAPVAADMPVADRRSLVHAGTLATRGLATGVVIATGGQTEIGRIGQLVETVKPASTPLLEQIGRFNRWLTAAIVAAAIALALLAILWRGMTFDEGFLAAVGFAVAAIPEGLPAIMTIALAVGVRRMARRHAIVRHLPAIETLGAVSVVCTDKTGTLTGNELTVRSLAIGGDRLRVTGTGLEPAGDIQRDGRSVIAADEPAVRRLVEAGILCNDADVAPAATGWRANGDPLEAALLVLAAKARLDAAEMRAAFPRVAMVPFDAERRLMATLHRNRGAGHIAVVKGAPESVLSLCADSTDNRSIAAAAAQADEMARRGERVIAFASRSFATSDAPERWTEFDGHLEFIGLCGFIDPPRPEAMAAVRRCRRAGVSVKIITGDHAETARAVARDFELADRESVRTGKELDGLDDDAFDSTARQIDIFARIDPRQKLRLVESLRRQGFITAMTGDGVNDAPALRQADVGIAMGAKGTEAAKEASQIVLSDDNFASIAAAIEEGRVVYDNLRKSIIYILPTSIGEALIIVAAILFGVALPITPILILWVNLVTEITLSLALAFEKAEPDVMARPPRQRKAPLLAGNLAWRVAVVTTLIVVGTFWQFEETLAAGASIAEARSVAVNLVVLFEVFYLANARSLSSPGWRFPSPGHALPMLAAITTVMILQLLLTYLPAMNRVFGTAPLSPEQWGIMLMIASSVFVVIEIERLALTLLHRWS